VESIKQISEQIEEECDKEKVDESKVCKLRFEQMLRGLYLQVNPADMSNYW
jgi:hypothetical protein